jgi:hypothetical protein
LLARLKGFLASLPRELASSAECANVDQLTKLVRYIERREPCFPADIAAGWRREAE